MKDQRKHQHRLLIRTALALMVAGAVGCRAPQQTEPSHSLPDYVPGIGLADQNGLSPAQDYAGEAMAYMLQVVVGHSGEPEYRPSWRTVGLDVALDFSLISRMMTETANRENSLIPSETPGAAQAYRKADLIAFDTNLMGLAKILYHYNPRLNQFKGRYVFDSQYPSQELIAVRLLIIRKINRSEKVRFSALLQRESLFHSGAELPTEQDLKAMNLSEEEFLFIKDIFASEPVFFKYYKHPFIVASMTQIGFYQKESLTEEMFRRASYKNYAIGQSGSTETNSRVTIAILPSLIDEFTYGDVYDDPYIFGFKPTAEYLAAVRSIEAAILNQTAGLVREKWRQRQDGQRFDSKEWRQYWQHEILPQINIQSYAQRPFSIHPENAGRAIHDICPKADLAIILLGKDVQRSMHLHRNNGFAATGRFFIDYADVAYLSGTDDIKRIGRYIADHFSPIS